MSTDIVSCVGASASVASVVLCVATLPQWSLRGFRRLLVAVFHELMQGEGDFVRMRCAPRDDALQLDGIVSDGADFHQLGFDDLWLSHRNSSMAHIAT